jgi:hypothetical protein
MPTRDSGAQTLLAKTHWVSSWGAAQQIPEPLNALPTEDLRDATLREIVHLSIGGSPLCLHLSNAFGTVPLHLNSVHIALAVSSAGAAIVQGTDRAVTFAGKSDVTIPAGAEYLSDPINYTAAPASDVAISIHYDEPPAQQTGHPGSHAGVQYEAGQIFLRKPLRCHLDGVGRRQQSGKRV